MRTLNKGHMCGTTHWYYSIRSKFETPKASLLALLKLWWQQYLLLTHQSFITQCRIVNTLRKRRQRKVDRNYFVKVKVKENFQNGIDINSIQFRKRHTRIRCTMWYMWPCPRHRRKKLKSLRACVMCVFVEEYEEMEISPSHPSIPPSIICS